MSMISISVAHESWPLRQAFTISRGSKSEANVVVVTLRGDGVQGHGEAVPYGRYGETIEDALTQIRALDVNGLTRASLQAALKPGAARNAVDCALWDLDAKRSGASAASAADFRAALKPVLTAFTISLDTPDVMAAKARDARQLPLLKLKLGGAGDADRMRAVRQARPGARLIADANEAWSIDDFDALMAVAAETGMEAIEQPLPERDDEALRGRRRPVPLCADESLRTFHDLARLAGLYDAVNIKLDKTGGLTAALDLKRAARAAGLKIMIGSMVATSLAVAPALLLAQDAEWTDLDGPLLLAKDREFAIAIQAGVMSPADPRLWG